MSRKKDILIALGDYFRKKIKVEYKSNVDLAMSADVDEKTIRNILAGKNVSIKLIKKICDCLEIKMSDLFKEIGY